MRALLELEDPPTAVFLSNYEITMGAVIALNEAGVEFPEKLSIIGFDNLLLSKVIRPKLWMVVQPMEEIAKTAAELMLGRLKNEKRKNSRRKTGRERIRRRGNKRVRTAKCAVKNQHLSRRIHSDDKACLINHFCNLSVSVCVRFCFHSVDAPAVPSSFR